MSESERLDMAADQAIAAHDGDPRRLIRSLLLVRWRLEAKLSRGFIRGVQYGRFKVLQGSRPRPAPSNSVLTVKLVLTVIDRRRHRQRDRNGHGRDAN